MSNADERHADTERESLAPRACEVIVFPGDAERRAEQGARRPLRDVVGEVLREERHRQQRTLADVAAGAAVSLPYLSEVERGRKDVSSDLLGAVCDELAVPLAEVLERCVERLRIEARAAATSRVHLLAA